MSARATRRRTSRAVLVAARALGGVACAMGVSIPRGLAALIFRRHRKAGGRATFTDLSDAVSVETNTHYAKLFGFFQARPELSRQPLYRRALLAHLPRMIRDSPAFRLRVKSLPAKYRAAMLAVEIASSIVYRGGFERHFEEDLEDYLARMFA